MQARIPIIWLKRYNVMTAANIVFFCLQSIMKLRGIKTNALATRSGVTPSSVYSLLDPRRKEVSVSLVKKLCDGLEITLGEFFSSDVFDDLEQEIR